MTTVAAGYKVVNRQPASSTGLVGAVVVLGVYLFLRAPTKTGREAGPELGLQGGPWWNTTRDVISVRSYCVVGIVFVLIRITSGARETWLATHFHDTLGMDLGEAGFFSIGSHR